jgi:flagellin
MKIKSPASSLVQTQANKTQARMNKLFDQISSGARITKAADDAASLAISSAMESQISALRSSRQNANEADSMLQVADAGFEQAQEIVGRMRELAVSASNGTRNDADRAASEIEFQSLRSELNDLAASTDFNDRPLLDGAQSFTFQVGAEEGATIEVSTDRGVSAADLGVAAASVASQGSAQASIEALEEASSRVSESRSRVGAGSSRLRVASSAIESAVENTVAANSQLRDLDMVEALSAKARESILQQSNIAILMQANAMPQAALSLIG